MRERRKPFVVYRRGPGSFSIVPRGVAGWAQFAVWMALLAALVIWFVDHIQANTKGPTFFEVLGLFGAGLLASIVGGIWWMLAHAEVVDVAELTRDRQRQARKQQRKEL
ncbi:hypothetical protein [Erythrobacter donghaensis]|uniref:hypothetical protein n=1 Tax=Erythrobacter donghaensis TaxID=267135 RepID=UPI000A387B47|nr:hypothetical protein [Erythrobacter donghaensis]